MQIVYVEWYCFRTYTGCVCLNGVRACVEVTSEVRNHGREQITVYDDVPRVCAINKAANLPDFLGARTGMMEAQVAMTSGGSSTYYTSIMSV